MRCLVITGCALAAVFAQLACASEGSEASTSHESTLANASSAQGSGGGTSAAGGLSAGAGGDGGAVTTGGGGAGGNGGASGGAGGEAASGGAGGSGSGAGAGGAGGAGGGGITDTPCSAGDGYALWRLAWPPNAAGYATVEAWDNGCAYSLADQACRLSGEPHDYADFGPGIELDSSTDFFRVRFSVQGLSFSSATLYISAHADGGGIPNGVLESPLHGSTTLVPMVPISQHQDYAVDWTSFLSPLDEPSLTAVTLTSMPVGLAVSKMELCVE